MSQPTTKGPMQGVPCPHCGFKLDCSDPLFHEVGALLSCDSCKKMSEVRGIQKVTVMTLQASNKTSGTGLVKR